jgi:hypothetical protein
MQQQQRIQTEAACIENETHFSLLHIPASRSSDMKQMSYELANAFNFQNCSTS